MATPSITNGPPVSAPAEHAANSDEPAPAAEQLTPAS
jgi:hypothetical protein